MSAAQTPIDRRALRRNDPAALATILVGQLTAYRCSTVYSPTATRLDAFVRDEILPRLRESLDVREVIVERWDKKKGPTVQQLVEAIATQLEIEPEDPTMKPMAALEATLRRAERRSERPLLLVLYRLETLLDKGRDPGEVSRFVDALARMTALPMHGLHIVLGVKEEDLGAFRELLRGRWRLLANDIRIRPSGKKWLLSLPLMIVAYTSSNTVAVTTAAAVCAGAGAGVGAVAGIEVAEQRTEALQTEVEGLRRRLGARGAGRSVAAGDGATTESTTTEATTDTTTDTTTDDTTTDATTTDGATTDGTTSHDLDTSTDASETEVEPAPKPDLCDASSRDGHCGVCVRAQCCDALRACKKSKWRRCVLRGKIGGEDCLPEMVELECRSLALCALENTCRADCFIPEEEEAEE
ncbi:MAG: hypothetical protein IPK80_15675 [Nannocystis sp.]|nr:hypothetical protein [Nannocystis sp.]